MHLYYQKLQQQAWRAKSNFDDCEAWEALKTFESSKAPYSGMHIFWAKLDFVVLNGHFKRHGKQKGWAQIKMNKHFTSDRR